MKTETAKATKQEIFTKLQKSVALDKRLEKTTASLFLKMLGLAMISNFTTMTFSAKIEQLAEALAMSTRTVRRHLPKLIRFGYVLANRHKSGRKMNMPNVYTMLNPFEESQQRLCEANSVKILGQDWQANTIETLSRDIRTKETNIREAETSSVGFSTPSYVTLEAPSEAPKVCEANLNETDCGELKVQSPKQKTISKAETVESSQAPKKPETAPKGYDLSGLPEILHATAILYLDCTGRTELTEKDKQILRELLVNHYPARIQGEILHRLELFATLGRTPRQMTLSYIYAILKNQRSRPLDEPEAEATQAEPVTAPQTEAIYERVVSPHRKSNKKATKRAPKAELNQQSAPKIVSEPAPMPVAEAEKVIADYEAEHVKPAEQALTIPAALEELFTKIQDRECERGEEYAATLPEDEYGVPVWPEDDELGRMPLEDYLRLKYPEAEEEELCRDYSGHVYGSVNEHSEASRLQAAFEIDYACAMCINPDACQLPEGYKKGQPKPEAKMFTSKDGKRCLGTGFEGCIKCKHVNPAEKTPEEKRQEAEFKCMINQCGIARRERTFENYHPETPEEIAAKAMAILAVKRQRNLVLAGNAGTGKTHLATGIAIEAMRNGKQARVVTACEMLDEICQAYRDNTEPLGVLLKYKRVPVLVIDDLDKAKMTDARLDYLYQIVNDRYERGLQTIVTTNAYNMAGLECRWCSVRIEPIMSRLLENGDWVTIQDAENYRLKKHATDPRVGKVEPVEEAEPEIDILEAEALAEFEQMGAELGNPEHKLIEEAIAEVEAECHNKEASEPPTWQEIAQSSEYQALSESDKLKKQWEYLSATPEYKNMWNGDKVAVQLEFVRRIREAEQLAHAKPEPKKQSYCEHLPSGGYVIHVPHYDDGLDDDEGDIKL